MKDSIYVLEILLKKFENIADETPIDVLLINKEEIELYLSGREDQFWITNKRIIAHHHGYKAGFIFDDKFDQYTSFKYTEVFSISVDYIPKSNYNRINIIFNNDVQLHLMIHGVLPITDIAQVLNSKIFN